MKYTNLAAFKKHIDDAYPKHFSPVYFIISPDSFARKQALMTYVSTDLMANAIL